MLAWGFRITLFVPNETWLETAAIPGVSAAVVVALVGGFYFVMVALTFWPTTREAKGEFYDAEPGEWKTRSEE